MPHLRGYPSKSYLIIRIFIVDTSYYFRYPPSSHDHTIFSPGSSPGADHILFSIFSISNLPHPHLDILYLLRLLFFRIFSKVLGQTISSSIPSPNSIPIFFRAFQLDIPYLFWFLPLELSNHSHLLRTYIIFISIFSIFFTDHAVSSSVSSQSSSVTSQVIIPFFFRIFSMEMPYPLHFFSIFHGNFLP